MSSKIAIVILNWNGWQDTCACLESLLVLIPQTSAGVVKQIIVCDNSSSNDSILHLREWFQHKKISLFEYNSADIDTYIPSDSIMQPQFTLLHNGDNLGYAGGNNRGIAFALKDANIDWVWILNNDTLLTSDALQQLLQVALEDKQIGICGSSLVYEHDRITVQAVGARYNPYFAIGQHLSAHQPISHLQTLPLFVENIDYVVGAAMLVSRAFIENTGEMSESYFLYFEEIDWAMRNQKRFKLGVATRSIVYHKEGASIQGKQKQYNKSSYTADYYRVRNQIRFTQRFYPLYTPLVRLSLFLAVFNRIRRQQFRQAALIFKWIFTWKP